MPFRKINLRQEDKKTLSAALVKKLSIKVTEDDNSQGIGKKVEFNPNNIRTIIYELIRPMMSSNPRKMGQYKRSYEYCTNFICDQIGNLRRNNHSVILDMTIDESTTFVKKVTVNTLSRYEMIRDDIDVMDRALSIPLTRREKSPFNKVTGTRLTIYPDKHCQRLVLDHSDEYYCLTTNELKIIRSKVLEAWILFSCSEGMSQQALPSTFHQDLVDVVKWCYKENLKGREGVSPTKLIEPLATGHLLGISDNFDNWAFANLIYRSYKNARYHGSDIYHLLSKFTAPGLVELQSVCKLLGPAYTCPEESFNKIIKRISGKEEVDPVDIQRVTSFTKYEMCRIYYHRKRRWPIVRILNRCPRTIAISIVRNRWVNDREIVKRYGAVGWSDFRYIEFCETFPWDPCSNSWALKDDRSISPRRNRVRNYALAYQAIKEAEESGSIKDYASSIASFRESGFSVKETSLLVWMVNQREINSYLERTTRNIIEDPLIIRHAFSQRLVEKMGELKEGAARVFGCMTPEMRHYRSVNQENFRRSHRFFNPLDAMTTDDVDRYKALKIMLDIAGREGTRDDDYIYCIFFIDATEWAESWTANLCQEVGHETLGKFFGTDAVQHYMETYDNEFIMLESCGDLFVYGPKHVARRPKKSTGLPTQGSAQKSWSYLYNSIVKMSMMMVATLVFVLNNGDNLTSINRYSKRMLRANETIAEFFERQLDLLKRQLQRYGLKIKAEESTYSQSVAVICKQVMQHGRVLGTYLKRVCKLGPSETGQLQTTEGFVSTSSSTAHSVCQQSVSNLLTYTVYISRIYVYFKERRVPDKEITKILCRPSVLGGYPILTLMDILVRGGSDQLTRALQLLSDFRDHGSASVKNATIHVLTHTPLEFSGSPSRYLLTNPQGLPVIKTKPAEQFLQDEVLVQLRNSRNECVRKMVRLKIQAKRTGETELERTLLDMKPFMPTLASEIYAQSEESIIDEFLQITKTDTITNVYLMKGRRYEAVRVMNGMERLDLKRLTWIVNTPEGDIERHETCPCRWAWRLRQECFGPIFNETYPPEIGTVRAVDYNSTAEEMERAPLFKMHLPRQRDPRERNDHNVVLTRKIDIESETSAKWTYNVPRIGGQSPLLRRAEALLRLIANLGVNNLALVKVLSDYLEKMCGGYIKKVLETITFKYSGAFLHRAKTIYGKSLLSGANMPASITVNILAVLYAAPGLIDPRDLSIHYQMLKDFCKIICSWMAQLPGVGSPSATFRFTVTSCKDCVRPVDDPVITLGDISSTLKGILIPSDSEIEYAEKAIDEELKDRNIKQIGNILSNEEISVARTVLSCSLVCRKDEMINNLLRDENIHHASGSDIEALKSAYAIGSAGTQISLNDLRSLPVSEVMRAVVSEALGWCSKGKRMFVGDLSLIDTVELEIYELPFEGLAADLVDSMYIYIIASEFQRKGYPAPGPQELKSHNAVRRYLLRCSIFILKLYTSGDTDADSYFYSTDICFGNDQDDDAVVSALERRLLFIVYLRSKQELRKYSQLAYSDVVANIIYTLEHVVECDFDVEGEISLLDRETNKIKFPKKAKDLSQYTKVVCTNILHFDWWNYWKVIKGKTSYQIYDDLLDKVVSFGDVNVFRMNLRTAISVCRSNPDNTFQAFIKNLREDSTPLPRNTVVMCQDMIRLHNVSVNDLIDNGYDIEPIEPLEPRLIREPYHITHINRPVGSHVTSANKFLDILQRFQINGFHNCATVCEGDGGWARVLLGLMDGTLVYNTYLDPDSPGLPSEVMKSEHRSRALVYETMYLPGDWTRSATVEMYSDITIKKVGRHSIDLVTCDGQDYNKEKQRRQGFELMCSTMRYIRNVGSNGCVGIIKHSMSSHEVLETLCVAAYCSREMAIYRSVCTFADSNEYFVITRGTRNNVDDLLDAYGSIIDNMPVSIINQLFEMYESIEIQPVRRVPNFLALNDDLLKTALMEGGSSLVGQVNRMLGVNHKLSDLAQMLVPGVLGRTLADWSRQCLYTAESHGMMRSKIKYYVYTTTITWMVEKGAYDVFTLGQVELQAIVSRIRDDLPPRLLVGIRDDMTYDWNGVTYSIAGHIADIYHLFCRIVGLRQVIGLDIAQQVDTYNY